jgi:hypothetical protein
MKTVVFAGAILLVVLAFVVSLIAAENDANTPQVQVQAVEQTESAIGLIDPNDQSHGLGKYRSEVQRYNRSVNQEARQLARQDGNRVQLLNAIQEQVIAELELIKKMAQEENATKTVNAIDHLIAKRTQNFERIRERLGRARAASGDPNDPNAVDRRPRMRERVNPQERAAQREQNRPREPRQRTERPQRTPRTRESVTDANQAK